MIQRKPAQRAKVSTLAQQQADFTAEGSPPPGQVATSAPVTVDAATVPSALACTPRAVRKGPVARSRWQR